MTNSLPLALAAQNSRAIFLLGINVFCTRMLPNCSCSKTWRDFFFHWSQIRSASLSLRTTLEKTFSNSPFVSAFMPFIASLKILFFFFAFGGVVWYNLKKNKGECFIAEQLLVHFSIYKNLRLEVVKMPEMSLDEINEEIIFSPALSYSSRRRITSKKVRKFLSDAPRNLYDRRW